MGDVTGPRLRRPLPVAVTGSRSSRMRSDENPSDRLAGLERRIEELAHEVAALRARFGDVVAAVWEIGCIGGRDDRA